MVACDSWFGKTAYSNLYANISESSVHLLSRLRSNTVLYSMPQNETSKKRGRPRKYGLRLGSCSEMAAKFISQALIYRVFLYGNSEMSTLFQTRSCQNTQVSRFRVVWVFRKTQWVSCFYTDMDLSIQQIIKNDCARWKVELGFKEIKQDIGSSKSQTRNAHAVMNHINFSTMAATITWIYGCRLENTPQRRHKVKGRNSFAFSDLRQIIANTALNGDFSTVCHKQVKLHKNLSWTYCCVWPRDKHRAISVKLQ